MWASVCVRVIRTNRVDVGPLHDQADYCVFTKRPGSHVQRRHPVAVDGVDVGAAAGQNGHCSFGRVAHAEVESRPSFHLKRDPQMLSLFNILEILFGLHRHAQLTASHLSVYIGAVLTEQSEAVLRLRFSAPPAVLRLGLSVISYSFWPAAYQRV